MRWPWQIRQVIRCLAIPLLLLVSACDAQIQAEANPAQPKPAAIPRAQEILVEDYNLQVSGTGEMRWNGHPISLDELHTYTDQLGGRAENPGRLVVQFEAGAPSAAMKSVRRALAGSHLCHSKRCAEASWDAPRPRVVY